MWPSLLSYLWGAMSLHPEWELNCCLMTSTLAQTGLSNHRRACPDLSLPPGQCHSDGVYTSLSGVWTAPSKEAKAITNPFLVWAGNHCQPSMLVSFSLQKLTLVFFAHFFLALVIYGQETDTFSSSCTECCSAQALGCCILFPRSRQCWAQCDQNGVGCTFSLMNKSVFCVDK